MHPPKSHSERPNTLGMPSKKLDALLELLDGVTPDEVTIRRKFSRWPFRQTTIPITITHPGGSVVNLRLACRNISCGGVGLLHTSFIHPGSVCVVELPNSKGLHDKLPGVVQRCSHRRGTLHELGIKFARSIELANYVPGQAGVHSFERVDAHDLTGTALYVDPSDTDLELF